MAARFFDDLSVESDTGELNKKFLVRLRQIYGSGAVAFDDVPAKFEIVNWQTKLGRENIHCADRQEAQGNIRAGQAIHDFVDGAVAARGYDFFETFFCATTRH